MSKIKETSSVYYLKKIIFEGIDVATKTFELSSELLKFNSISVHVIFTDLTGTLDGTATLSQSSDKTLPYVQIPTLTGDLDVASGSLMLESSEFISECLSLSISKGSITGGTITAVLIAKRK